MSDVDRVERFTLTLRFFDGVVVYFFNSDFKFFDDASEFSVCSFYVACIFSLFMLIFLQFSIGTRAVVTSSRRRLFCFHNFVFCRNAPLSQLHFHFLSEICDGQPEFLCALLL